MEIQLIYYIEFKFNLKVLSALGGMYSIIIFVCCVFAPWHTSMRTIFSCEKLKWILF